MRFLRNWVRAPLQPEHFGGMFGCECADCRRAEQLLCSVLTPAQQHQLRTRLYFDVTTPAGHQYRLVPGGSFNIYAVPLGERYCLESVDLRLPLGDVLLAQKLMLEADEEMFLRLANRRNYP